MEILGLIRMLTLLKKHSCQKFFFEWLAEVFVQRLPTEKELEIPDIYFLVMIKGF